MNREKLKSLVIDRNFAIYDSEFYRALKQLPWAEWTREPRPFFCRREYLERFDAWILGSRLNQITGLGVFSERHLINGTTQTFDEAYFAHRSRRLRVFRGEYAYHRRVLGPLEFLDDAPLAPGDYVIVSAPFCSTGDLHPALPALLHEAARLGVPVIIDCAYFGTCEGITLDLSHPAIESVSFSLTKGLGMGDVRSGVRYSRLTEGGIFEQNRFEHTVLAAARIGLYMMERFSADHIPNKFREAQREVCATLGVEASRCMHIGLGGSEWDHFRVDGKYNTLGLREAVKAIAGLGGAARAAAASSTPTPA